MADEVYALNVRDLVAACRSGFANETALRSWCATHSRACLSSEVVLKMLDALATPTPVRDGAARGIAFTVYGVAEQMGSKRAFVPKGWSRPVITDSNRNLKSWQTLVAESAQHAIAKLPEGHRTLFLDGVRLTVAFYFPRPKSLPKKVTAHLRAPDLDKVVRAVGDALSQVVFRDDRQVVDLVAMKRYAAEGDVPRVEVRVESSNGGSTR